MDPNATNPTNPADVNVPAAGVTTPPTEPVTPTVPVEPTTPTPPAQPAPEVPATGEQPVVGVPGSDVGGGTVPPAA